MSPPDPGRRQPFSRPVAVDVRPHVGVMGVAPAAGGRRSSIPPGVFGGNVDNWRFGPGAVVRYPVFVEGARFYVGDPHFAQGDGEICGTAIEASLDVRLRLSVERGVAVPSPVLETPTHLFTHGFGADLDEAMRMAAELAVQLLVDRGGVQPRRGLLAGVGGRRRRRDAGRRRHPRLPRRRPQGAARLTVRPIRVCGHQYVARAGPPGLGRVT